MSSLATGESASGAHTLDQNQLIGLEIYDGLCKENNMEREEVQEIYIIIIAAVEHSFSEGAKLQHIGSELSSRN